MKKQKVVVAMSGGVDSGVAAALLVEEGYEVLGIHLNLWTEGIKGIKGIKEDEGFLKEVENRCCNLEGLEAARKTAAKLGIPFYVKDYAKDFKKIVVDYFLEEYAAGRTPNPCVVCNRFIKFGKLLEYTRALGCDYLATGHYARIVVAPSHGAEERAAYDAATTDKRYRLLKGIDDSKDQSYFLWTLNQDKLAHILFPVGDLTKPEVRKIARVKNLPVSERPESFEICFIRDNDYRDFLKRHIPEAVKPGEAVNAKGEVVGRHFGLPLYTIGQRKGFEMEDRRGIPLYVVGIDREKNRLIVGRGAESERKEFVVGGVNWVDPALRLLGSSALGCQVRTRHQGPLMAAKLKAVGREPRAESRKLKAVLDEPVRGITPGQSAVFYRGEEVLGGGVIEN